MTVPSPRHTLRHGRDPNDGSWVIARYPRDWQGALLRNTAANPLGDIELAIAGTETAPLPSVGMLHCATTASGAMYCAAPNAPAILLHRHCNSDTIPVRGLGGAGIQTGQLHTPRGLAFAMGHLYIADSGNHRVQVAALSDAGACAQVVSVLGATNEWGAPLEGSEHGAMQEPLDVAVADDTGWVYVADGAGRIHVWNDRHQFVCNVDLGESSTTASPIAIDFGTDGALWVLDQRVAHCVRLSSEGLRLPSLPAHAAHSPYRHSSLERRYEPVGETVLRLDSGQRDATWDRILLEAELPEGTSVRVQSCATDDSFATTPIDQVSQQLPWAPHKPLALASDENRTGELSQLVLSDTANWERAHAGWRRRVLPHITSFLGDGPSATSLIRMNATATRALRVGDSLKLERDDGLSQVAEIHAIPDTAFRATVLGAAAVYGPGTQVILQAKLDSSLLATERTLRVLSATESIDLSAAIAGKQFAGSLPQSVAAFLDDGDQILCRSGLNEARIYIDCLEREDLDIAVGSVIAADFSTARVSLIHSPGRIFVDRSDGFSARIVTDTEVEIGNGTVREVATISWCNAWDKDSSPADAALWLAPGTLGPAVSEADWTELAFQARTSDRGRYLWVRIILRGPRVPGAPQVASLTPRIKAVRATLPRHSYLQYLPATFARRDETLDPSGALFLERFLSLFEERLTDFEEAYESVSQLLNPEAASLEWLTFVGSWLGIVFDPSWPIERRRQLVLEANELYTRRGTRASISRYVEIYTGHKPALVEGFSVRPANTLELGGVTPLGCAALSCAEQNATSSLAKVHAHRFTIHAVLADRCDIDVAEGALRSILDSVTPAHTSYELYLLHSDMRVGTQSTVGVDTVLCPPQREKSVLGTQANNASVVVGQGNAIAPDSESFALASGSPYFIPMTSSKNQLGSNVRIDNELELR